MTDRPGSIIVGVDAEGRAADALAEAVSLGQLQERPVHAVHALDVGYAISTFGALQERERAQRELAQRIRAWAEERLPEGTSPPPLRVIWGNPAQVLLAQARLLEASLIVVGSHHRRPGDLFLTGTADRVLRGARCPVLVLRQAQPPSSPILVPIDLSEESRVALQIAARLASQRGSRLITLFVTNPPILPGPETWSSLAAQVAEATAELVDEYKSLVARNVGDLAERVLVESGDPRGRITEIAKRYQVGLVVMGSHGRTGLARWALGSVTEAVLRRTPLSVLAVKAQDRAFLLDAELDAPAE